MFKRTHLFEEQNTHQTADAKNAAYFDKLRAQETPEHKEQFLALAAYEGKDEILLCRKAQVLLNLQKIQAAHDTLKGLHSPLAIAINNLCLINLKQPYSTNYSFTGEAYAMMLVSKYHEAYNKKDYPLCLHLASHGIGASTALGMNYQAQIFKEAYNEAANSYGATLRYETQQTGNLIQATDKVKKDYRNALKTDNYKFIHSNNYTHEQKQLAKATSARQQRRHADAISYSSQINSLEGEYKAYLCLLRLELYCRQPEAKAYLEPEASFKWLQENLNKLEANEISLIAVRSYPLGAMYAKLKGLNINAENWILTGTKVHQRRKLICSGIPKKLETIYNTRDFTLLDRVTRSRAKSVLNKAKLRTSQLITPQLIEEVKKLI